MRQIQITVEKEQLLSHPLLVKDIDCLSVSPQQLRRIKRNFELPILRYCTPSRHTCMTRIGQKFP
jgi:hypothetical protein